MVARATAGHRKARRLDCGPRVRYDSSALVQVHSHSQEREEVPVSISRTIVSKRFSISAPTRFIMSPASQMYRKTNDRDSPDCRL